MNERRRGKPRQTSYLYRCTRCASISQRGSSAKWCAVVLWRFGKWRKCEGYLNRLKTVKGPVPVTLKVI